jgi:DNA-directed RNA polymerase subunit L
MNIEKDHCDYYLEVYYWEHTLVALVEKVVTKKEKVVLASVGLYGTTS